MKENFFPAKYSLRRPWLVNYKAQIAVRGPALGLLAPEITSRQTRCQNMIDSIDAQITADVALKTATANRDLVFKNEYGLLSKSIATDKNLGTYTTTIGEALGIIGSEHPFDPLTYATEITGTITPEGVRVTFKKDGAEGVRIYYRILGTQPWVLLGLDLHSPYIDNHPKANPNLPEVREYMAMGWFDDHEIGVISNIVVVSLV
ncbi:MAG: hypothetical protein NTX03_11925 [Bacteroidetes bacterium]|nr:hypothetical protein [Bacteroidota bacterium]